MAILKDYFLVKVFLNKLELKQMDWIFMGMFLLTIKECRQLVDFTKEKIDVI